jgi:hypothetical protein
MRRGRASVGGFIAAYRRLQIFCKLFQRSVVPMQAFPKNVLAVLCDFNDLYGLQIKSVTSKFFALQGGPKQPPPHPGLTSANGEGLAGTLAYLSFFRKKK